jgi:hypothetical protein
MARLPVLCICDGDCRRFIATQTTIPRQTAAFRAVVAYDLHNQRPAIPRQWQWQMGRLLTYIATGLMALGFGGCATTPTVSQSDIDALTLEIKKLGPEVDPLEAERAARIAYTYSQQLAQDYNVTDHPIVHNAKVNSGLRERGICVHWAEDVEKRLKQENFQTLTLHRGIAPPRNEFRIVHSTAIVSRRGDTMYDGIVLDPWRYGGTLYWSSTRDDPRYDWRPRMEVLAERARKEQAKISTSGG